MASATRLISRGLSRLDTKCHYRCSSTNTRRSGDDVRVVEVGPRDGLQNEKVAIHLESKLELIRRLAQTGVRDIEAGSFVAPKWVPQMANSAEVLHHLRNHKPLAPVPITYNFLVPNYKGFESFLAAKDNEGKDTTPAQSLKSAEKETNSQTARDLKTPRSDTIGAKERTSEAQATSNRMEISIFTAATEAFSKANTNCSISESLQRCEPIVSAAKAKSIRVRGYVSVALGCPYEGPDVDPNKVTDITRTLLAMGVDEVSVADTTGMGTAPKTQELMKALLGGGIAVDDLALHFHDTYGQALVNIIVGLECGVRTFDSSVGGLGGCPYSKGATGNVATEDLLHCLHSLGMNTGVSLEEMAKIGAWISGELGRANDSRAGKAVLARMSE